MSISKYQKKGLNIDLTYGQYQHLCQEAASPFWRSYIPFQFSYHVQDASSDAPLNITITETHITREPQVVSGKITAMYREIVSHHKDRKRSKDMAKGIEKEESVTRATRGYVGPP